MKEEVGRMDRPVDLVNTALYLEGCGYESTPGRLRSEVNNVQVNEGAHASTMARRFQVSKIPRLYYM
jgi:hypothetical protein